jgi:hypothetical protein
MPAPPGGGFLNFQSETLWDFVFKTGSNVADGIFFGETAAGFGSRFAKGNVAEDEKAGFA